MVLRKWKEFQVLSKSGIIVFVLITAAVGYGVGHIPGVPFDWMRLIWTVIATGLLSSGSAALNQIQEIERDRAMDRTKKRPLVAGTLTLKEAITFTGFCLVGGTALLFWLSVSLGTLGLIAVLSYNGLYTLWWKPKMAFAAVPGAIPGALPVAMGYISASGDWTSPGAWYLFFILFVWQMPHFWALALRYQADYSQGGFPTLPVARGEPTTLFNIRIWLLAYIGAWLMVPLFFSVHSIMIAIILLGSCFLVFTLRRYEREPHTLRWLEFFLAVNFSLILFLVILGIDLWSSVLFQHWIRT